MSASSRLNSPHRPYRECLLRVLLSLRPLLLVYALWPVNSHAWDALTDSLDLYCSQSKSLLACSYRLLNSTIPPAITAGLDEKPLTVTTNITYPRQDGVTAVLFLVDTSDPGRQTVINKNAGQIEQLLNNIRPYHRIGLAGFDKELTLSVPVGGTKEEIVSAARSMQAVGLTTELYRNTIRAIEMLGRTNADRKVIFLFSDGQAEDKAYFHQDVVNTSRKYGVVINTLGFPRSAALSVALQTLRRFSEETGGRFVESDASFNLPASFMDGPLDNIDRGGQFVIDFSTVEVPAAGNTQVDIRFGTSTGNISIAVPVVLPATQVTGNITNQSPATTPLVQNVVQYPETGAMTAEVGTFEPWLWYGVPVALLVLIVLTLISLLLLSRKSVPAQPVNTVKRELTKPFAYLIAQDEKATRYPVTSTIWRIGRSMDNEMTINDSSISRRHAEIQRSNSGKFVLYDRESTNGVFVNNKKINKHKLEEGDIIEIGDIYLRFTQHPLDYQFAESTAMLKTKAPIH